MFFLASIFDNLRENLQGSITFWTVFGLTGQLVFTSRFVLQWYVSEKLGRSVIPVQFWYLSIVGSLMLLIYSIHLGKVPLILGFLFPPIIYIRNLVLLSRAKKSLPDLEKTAHLHSEAADAEPNPEKSTKTDTP